MHKNPPLPPISPARDAGRLLFVSGQIGLDPVTGKLAADVGSQTAQAIKNLERALTEAGRSLGDVIRVGIYLANMGDYPVMNEVYGHLFKPPFPARTAIGVAHLPFDAAVEIDAVATVFS